MYPEIRARRKEERLGTTKDTEDKSLQQLLLGEVGDKNKGTTELHS